MFINVPSEWYASAWDLDVDLQLKSRPRRRGNLNNKIFAQVAQIAPFFYTTTARPTGYTVLKGKSTGQTGSELHRREF